MKKAIYTIPIQDAFERPDGCPICFLWDNLEKDALSYVLGAAMMEPDVRVETNRRGFCATHLQTLMGMNNRLSVALMLESLFGELQKTPASSLPGLSGDCYVCHRVDFLSAQFLDNILMMWRQDKDFRALFGTARALCLPHAAQLTKTASRGLGKLHSAKFIQAVWDLLADRVQTVHEDLSLFCKSFDYRFTGMELGQAKQAVEAGASLLCGQDGRKGEEEAL